MSITSIVRGWAAASGNRIGALFRVDPENLLRLPNRCGLIAVVAEINHYPPKRNLGGKVPGAQRGGHGRADPYHGGSQLAGGPEATDLIPAAPVFQVFQKSRDKQTRLK